MKTKQAVNPYLPSWEYVPDAEQKDFFFVFPFHLLPGAVYVEADTCRNDGD